MAGFPTEGRWRPSDAALVVDGDRVPLESIASYRALSLGGLAVCWVSYARGVSRAPRTFVVPRGEFDRVRAPLDGGASADASEVSTVGAGERWVLVAFGVGCLAVGPALWMLLPGEGAVVALYAGVLFGVFGAVFLWHAATD